MVRWISPEGEAPLAHYSPEYSERGSSIEIGNPPYTQTRGQCFHQQYTHPVVTEPKMNSNLSDWLLRRHGACKPQSDLFVDILSVAHPLNLNYLYYVFD